MMDYLQLAQDVVRRAAARGVEAEAVIMDEQETLIRVDRGQVEQLSQSDSKGLGVRVIDGGRVGFAGFGLGAIVGAPFCAEEPRIRVAALAFLLITFVSERILAYAEARARRGVRQLEG